MKNETNIVWNRKAEIFHIEEVIQNGLISSKLSQYSSKSISMNWQIFMKCATFDKAIILDKIIQLQYF